MDKGAQPERRGDIFGIAGKKGVFPPGPGMRVYQDRKIQSLFVAEVIVNRSKISPGPATDFPDGGVAKAFFGKDCPRGFQEAPTGFVAGRDFCNSIRQMNTIKTIVSN